MKLNGVYCLIGLALCASCEGATTNVTNEETEMPNFFKHFKADQLGSTKIVTPSATLGNHGDLVKMLDLSVPDEDAADLIVSLRSEYSTNQATVSQTITGPFHVIAATNAAPIAITTLEAHGLVSGQNVSLQGCMGNVRANITTTVTVTGPNTFTLDGSDGTLSPTNFAYTGGGVVLATSGGGTGSGAAQVGMPIVAFIQWGVGGGENQVDFDVPAPRFPALYVPVNPAVQPESNTGSGVQCAISASHLSVYVRNDGNLSPLTNPGGDYVGVIGPVKVIAFVSPGSVNKGSALQRTIYVAGGHTPGPPAATPLTPGNTTFIAPIPPFSQSFRVQRSPYGTPVRLQFFDNINALYREVVLGVNEEGPIPVDGNVHRINITNIGASNIDFAQMVFDVTPQ